MAREDKFVHQLKKAQGSNLTKNTTPVKMPISRIMQSLEARPINPPRPENYFNQSTGNMRNTDTTRKVMKDTSHNADFMKNNFPLMNQTIHEKPNSEESEMAGSG